MSLRSLSDSAVLAGFATVVQQSQQITAALLSHILEIEHRQLYRDMGCDSMRAFLVTAHHFSEDAAEKRLQVAHVVRRFPRILERIADGRLHLSAVLMLAGSLEESNAGELIEAATHRTRSQIQAMLFARKVAGSTVTDPQPEMALAGGTTASEPAPGRVKDSQGSEQAIDEPSPARGQGEPLTRIALRESTRAKLLHAHDLVAGVVPFGDHDRVIAQALDEFIARRMKRKFATTTNPRPHRRPTKVNPRTIPAEVRRAVYVRDGGRCTFVGPTGHRCESRAVQFDHIIPVALGGTSTVPNLRLRCRAHNQLEAERVFGREFMDRQRTGTEDSDHRDLIAGLRGLGYRLAEAKEAAGVAMQGGASSLEERMRAALAWLRPTKGVVTTRWGPSREEAPQAVCPA